jgi:hypothetical protein
MRKNLKSFLIIFFVGPVLGFLFWSSLLYFWIFLSCYINLPNDYTIRPTRFYQNSNLKINHHNIEQKSFDAARLEKDQNIIFGFFVTYPDNKKYVEYLKNPQKEKSFLNGFTIIDTQKNEIKDQLTWEEWEIELNKRNIKERYLRDLPNFWIDSLVGK